MPLVRPLTANEQLLLELVNRARLDPAGEAARYGIDLNGPDPGGDPTHVPDPTLTADPKPPLAHDPQLALAATRHSEDMLARDFFAHAAPAPAPDGVTPKARMETAGYDFVGLWATGENIAWSGTTGTLDFDDSILSHHAGLFKSVGHRENILAEVFRETGIAQAEGVFRAPDGNNIPQDFNASMLAHEFAASGSDIFLTGVAYDDLDGDDFYSVGEARANVAISVAGSGTQTAAAGGFAVALGAETGQVTLSYDWGGETRSATVAMQASNTKIDLVGGTRILSSGDLVLGDGVTEGGALGSGTLSLTGNALDNLLIAGGGDTTLAGGTGTDTARFSGARTDYTIADGDGAIIVTDTRLADDLHQGVNTLTGIETLRFSDGDYRAGDLTEQGQLTLSGQLHDLAGDSIAGASVAFTPDNAAPPGTGQTTDADGGFALTLAAGATGHLGADLAYGAGAPEITAGDALEVLRIAVGLDPSFGPAQGQNLVAADITADGRVTAGDALEVLRHAVGLESEHAPEWAFFDASTDWQAPAPNLDNIPFERGIDIAGLNTDLDADMTGILLGNMQSA